MRDMQKSLFFTLFFSAVGIFALSKNPAGSRQVDKFTSRLPLVNHALLLAEQIRFNSAIAMMLESGLLIDNCLEMAVGSVKNHDTRHALSLAKDRIKKGEPLAKSLKSSQFYSDFSISLLEVGEESGQLAPVFNELSSRARREFEGWIERVTTLLEPVLILLMGAIVGGVVVTMLLSIVSVNDLGI